jgi:ribosome modulation factor
MPDGVFGRDAELSVVDTFLAGLAGAPGALVLAGEPGAGKTTVLRAGLERADSLGYTAGRRGSPRAQDEAERAWSAATSAGMTSRRSPTTA